MDESKGAIYIASGEEHIKRARKSAKSLKKKNDIDVSLLTPDEDVSSEYFDRIKKIDREINQKGDSLLTEKDIIYDKNLYLDSDTFVNSEISDVFQLLDRFEIAMAFNEARAWYHEEFYENKNIEIPEAFPEYNSGVIAFRDTKKVRKLFKDWGNTYEEFEYSRNQPALRKVLFESKVNLGAIPPEYNFMTNTVGFASGDVKILHQGNSEVDLKLCSELLNEVEGKKVTTWEYEPFKVVPNSYKPFLNYKNKLKQLIRYFNGL